MVDGLSATLYRLTSSNFPYGQWNTVTGAAPAPFGYITNTASSAGDLTFYTSLAGSYDYMWLTDSTIATPSAIVTGFSVGLNFGSAFDLPFVWPADSVPVLN